MSTGTNRERIEQNNQKLEEIKNQVSNLPDYPDMEPIYATADYQTLNIPIPDGETGVDYLGYWCFLGDYALIYGKSSQYNPYLYKKIDDAWKCLTKVNVSLYNSWGYCGIAFYNDDYLWVTQTSRNDKLFKLHKISLADYSSETITPSGTATYFGDYYGADGLGNILIGRTNSLNMIKVDYDNNTFTYKGTEGEECVKKNTYVYNTFYASQQVKITQVNPETWEIKQGQTPRVGLKIYGLSFDETKIFTNDGIYSFSPDFTFGNKIAELNIDITSEIYCFNDKYYLCNNTLYTFDNDTNTFNTVITSNNSLKVLDNVMFSTSTYYDFIQSDTIIGYNINGEPLYLNSISEPVSSDALLNGYFLYTKSHQIISGTMPNNGGLNYTPSTEEQTIPAGYTSGGTVAGDSNLVANNIRLGTTIFGVEGNLEADKPDQTKTATPTIEEQVITPDTGYELASVTVGAVTSDIDSNIVSENIKKDVSILGVTGTLESGGSSDYNARLVPTNGKIISYITEISAQLDTSSVTDMSYMFDSCTNLTTIPLLDTSKVTNMENMFINCTSLTTIPLLDTSSVNDMRYMFDSCTNLTTIPLLDTSKVTTMQFMFNNCENLTTIPLLDTSNVGNMPYMFNNCTSLTTVPQLDTSSVINMNRIFNNCTSLSDESLNNILVMCKNAVKITSNKTLKYLGLTSEQATKCTTLSNYSAFTAAGWTTGY